MDTQVTVVGNLVADPRLSFTGNGQPVTSFRIASTPRRFDRATGEWRDGDTLYANVTCWRGLAENVAGSLKKGQSAIVMGRLSVRPYETKEGEKRQSVDIDAMAVGPELSRVITVVKRAERGIVPAAAERAGDGAAAPMADAPAADAPAWLSDAVAGSGVDSLIDDADFDDEFADPADGGGDLDGDGDAQPGGHELPGRNGNAENEGGALAGGGGRLKARFGIG